MFMMYELIKNIKCFNLIYSLDFKCFKRMENGKFKNKKGKEIGKLKIFFC